MDELIKIAQDAWFSKNDLMQSIHHLLRTHVIGTEEEKLFLRPNDKDFIRVFLDKKTPS
jgi:hypothetical protein